MTHPTIASLTNTQPAQPVRGKLECYFDSQYLYIVRTDRPTPTDFATVTQVYPPVAAQEA